MIASAVALIAFTVPMDVTVTPDERFPGVTLRDTERTASGALPRSWTPPTSQGSSQPGWSAPVRTAPPDRCHYDMSNPNWRCALVSDAPDTPPAAAAQEASAPRLTPGRILTAVREIGLPRLRLTVQPGGETLVGLDTILHTEQPDFSRTISLLGSRVQLEAAATSYTWHHGDGTTQQTSTPGAPYPSKDVVHRYERPAHDVRLSVDVTYEVRFRVDGGPWQTLTDTITATGPATTIDVREARPVLTAP